MTGQKSKIFYNGIDFISKLNEFTDYSPIDEFYVKFDLE